MLLKNLEQWSNQGLYLPQRNKIRLLSMKLKTFYIIVSLVLGGVFIVAQYIPIIGVFIWLFIGYKLFFPQTGVADVPNN